MNASESLGIPLISCCDNIAHYTFALTRTMIVHVRLPTQPHRCASRLQSQLKHQTPKHVRPRVSVRIPAEAAAHRQLHRVTTQAAGSTYASDARTQQAVGAAQLNEVRQYTAYSSNCFASVFTEQVFRLQCCDIMHNSRRSAIRRW